jgi:hypothetical protein
MPGFVVKSYLARHVRFQEIVFPLDKSKQIVALRTHTTFCCHFTAHHTTLSNHSPDTSYT